jgi:WD40 repeat protein
MSACRVATAWTVATALAAFSILSLSGAEIDSVADPRTFGNASQDWSVLRPTTLLSGSTAETAREPLVALASVPDGSKIATVDRKSAIRLYDAVDAKELRAIDGGKGGIAKLAFSPDGSQLITVGFDTPITVWNVATGKRERDLVENSGWILGLAVSPDGQYVVAAGYNKKLSIWGLSDGNLVRSIESESAVRDLAISSDGNRLAAACVDGQVRVWNTADWSRMPFGTHTAYPKNSVAFSPDNLCLAVGCDSGEIRLWNTVDGQELAILPLHLSQVTELVFSPGGKTLFSCAANGDVAVWDVTERRVLQNFAQHHDEVTGLMWSRHHRALVTVGADGAQRVRFANIAPAHVKSISESVATWSSLSPDGQLFVATNGNSQIQLTDLANSRPVQTLEASSAIRCLTVSASNQLVAAGVDRRLRVWDLATAALIGESPPLEYEAVCLDTSIDRQCVVIGTTNHIVQLVDISKLSTPVVRWSSPAQSLAFSCVVFSPDGKSIATASRNPEDWRASGAVKLWESATGREIANLGRHSAEVLGLCFDAEGQRLATFGSFYDVRIWQVATAKELAPLPIRAYVAGAAFSRDGKRLILAQSDGPVAVWSLARQMPLHEFDGHDKNVVALVASRDGKLAVTRDVNNQAKLWKVPDE